MALRVYLSAAGLFVSAVGKSALSTTPGDLLINPANLSTRVFAGGYFNASPPSGSTGTVGAQSNMQYPSTWYVFPHNLGYIPIFAVDYDYPAGNPGGSFYVDTANYYAMSGMSASAIMFYMVFFERWV